MRSCMGGWQDVKTLDFVLLWVDVELPNPHVVGVFLKILTADPCKRHVEFPEMRTIGPRDRLSCYFLTKLGA